MMETWYVLDGGDVADPRDIVRDKAGLLCHKDGRAVAYSPHGPRTRSVDADAERAKKPAPEPREMKAERPRRGYKTRAIEAD